MTSPSDDVSILIQADSLSRRAAVIPGPVVWGSDGVRVLQRKPGGTARCGWTPARGGLIKRTLRLRVLIQREGLSTDDAFWRVLQ